jgi:hypothetical protein
MNGETLAKLLDERMDDYVDTAVATIVRQAEYDNDEFIRQVHHGFATVVRAAIDGDLTTRDRYIEGVVHGVRDTGLGIGQLMRGMVETAMLLTSWATANGAGESLSWLLKFLGEYTELLAKAYAE